jgi:hypothetical protein
LKIYACIAVMLISVAGTSQVGGSTIFNSLEIPSSARVAAVGGNLISVKESDLNLAIFNPSLLDSTFDQQMALSYVNYFSDVNFGYASYARQINSKVTGAATLQYMGYGQFDETNAIGEDIGQFSAGDFALTVGAGMAVDTSFTVGANVKMLYSVLADYNSFGAAVDLSGTYHNPARRLTAALVVRNLGYQFTTYRDDNREDLPINVQLGISKQLKHAPFRFSVIAEHLEKWDLTYENANEEIQIDPISGEVINDGGFEFGDKFMRHIITGVEMLISENIHIRLGYNYRRRQEMKISDKPGTAGLSWGFGINIRKFNLSYGRATYHLAGPSNHFTIATNLSRR